MVIMYHNVFPPYKGERFTAVSKLFSVSCTLLWALPGEQPTAPLPEPLVTLPTCGSTRTLAVPNPTDQWSPTWEQRATTAEASLCMPLCSGPHTRSTEGRDVCLSWLECSSRRHSQQRPNITTTHRSRTLSHSQLEADCATHEGMMRECHEMDKMKPRYCKTWTKRI